MFELSGRAAVLSKDYDGSLTYEINAIWNINDNFAATAAYEHVDIDDFIDDVDIELSTFRLGARLKF